MTLWPPSRPGHSKGIRPYSPPRSTKQQARFPTGVTHIERRALRMSARLLESGDSCVCEHGSEMYLPPGLPLPFALLRSNKGTRWKKAGNTSQAYNATNQRRETEPTHTRGH